MAQVAMAIAMAGILTDALMRDANATHGATGERTGQVGADDASMTGAKTVDPAHVTVRRDSLGFTAASLPSVTHRVARDRINARAGPGTSHRIVRKLTRGTLLALIETRDGWGHFALSNGGTPAPRLWAALRLVEPVEGYRQSASMR